MNDKTRFIALSGNEFGIHVFDEVKFTTLEEAEMRFEDFFDEEGFGAGVIYELVEGGLKMVKNRCHM